jgi:hypothetical protein
VLSFPGAMSGRRSGIVDQDAVLEFLHAVSSLDDSSAWTENAQTFACGIHQCRRCLGERGHGTHGDPKPLSRATEQPLGFPLRDARAWDAQQLFQTPGSVTLAKWSRGRRGLGLTACFVSADCRGREGQRPLRAQPSDKVLLRLLLCLESKLSEERSPGSDAPFPWWRCQSLGHWKQPHTHSWEHVSIPPSSTTGSFDGVRRRSSG